MIFETDLTLEPLTLAHARQLAHMLANVDKQPAYVVNIAGHPHLASAEDIDLYWPAESIVYTARPFTEYTPDAIVDTLAHRCADCGEWLDEDYGFCPKCAA